VRLIGCCGDPERMRRDYDQAFLEQTLAEGGRVVSAGPDGIELVDRRGRTHRVGPGVTLPQPDAGGSASGCEGGADWGGWA
jgi:hypothetical protein